MSDRTAIASAPSSAWPWRCRTKGKKVWCWNEDPIPQKYEFLDPDRMIQKPKPDMEFDCVIATDAASFERLGAVGACVGKRKVFINIDHHQSNTRYADINWVSAREPSTGELIFKLLKAAKWPITRRIADCLFTAVSTDTGFVPVSQHAAGNLSCRGRTGPPRREPGQDLRRGLSILPAFPRALAAPCL